MHLREFHFQAENFAEVMAGQRRRWALERVSAILHEYLEQQLETVPTLPSANAANFVRFNSINYFCLKNYALRNSDFLMKISISSLRNLECSD